MSPLMLAARTLRSFRCLRTRRCLGFLLAVTCLAGLLLAPALGPLSRRAQAAAGHSALPPAVFTPLDAATAGAFFDTRIPAYLDRYHIAGATVAVVQDGAVVFTRGYGVADVATGAPVEPAATLFHIGSLTKLFTWTAVMQLVEQGNLDLHTDVNTYLDFSLPATYGEPITLWHLMTHTAGFENRNFGYGAAGPNQLHELATWLRTHIPARVRPPGAVAAYSNYGTALAGYIVARVSGLAYEDYVEQRIFQPLGMAHTSVRPVPPPALQAATARGYTYDPAARRFMPVAPPLFEVGPAGAIAATAEDMARFMLAHLGDASGRAASAGVAGANPSLLSPATLALMHATAFRAVPYDPASTGLVPTGRVPTAGDANAPSAPPMPGMALGFFELSRHGEHIVGHVGAALPAFHSLLALLPDRNTGFFVSFNSAGAQPLTTGASAILLRDFVDHFVPELPAASSALGAVSPAEAVAAAHEGSTGAYASAYAGAYRFANNPTSSITTFEKSAELLGQPVTLSAPGDGTLHLVDAWGEKRFVAVAPHSFREVDPAGNWGDDILAFTAFSGAPAGNSAALPDLQTAGPATGQAAAFALGSRSSQSFERLPWYASPAVAQALLALCLVLLLTVAAAPLLAALHAAWRRRGPQSIPAAGPATAPRTLARRLVFMAALLNLVFVAGFAAIMLLAPASIALGQVAVLGVILAFPVAALLLACSSLPALWYVWRERWWSLPARLHFTTAVAALLAFAAVLHQWNLLGWRF